MLQKSVKLWNTKAKSENQIHLKPVKSLFLQ